jgi:type II secretory pathway pseudopilin PulG
MRVRVKKGQRGLSLIEVTIMLLVLMLLTSVLVPSVFDFINDAQWVKVKEDCEAIAISVTRLHRDVGANLYTDPVGRTAYPVAKLDLLISDGTPPIVTPATAITALPGGPGGIENWYGYLGGALNYQPATNPNIDSCEDQLITNLNTLHGGTAQIYLEPPQLSPMGVFGPYFGQGWRGAYLSPPCAADPWGHTYQVNTKWATMTFTAAIPPEFHGSYQHCNDVFCVSAGKDGVISTPFGVNVGTYPQGTRRRGDDWTTVISPCDP